MKWIETTLGDVCDKITDGTHSTVIDDPNGGNYLLSCKNIKNGRVSYSQKDRTINQETLEFLKRRTSLSQNDVLVSSVGTIGETAYIKEENPIYDFQRSVAILKGNPDEINYLFLYYTMRVNKTILKSLSDGAVQKCLFLKDFRRFKIRVPERLEDQEKIAQVLSSLDSKIELLQEQNKTLEELSQAIFKNTFSSPHPSWKINRLGDVLKISYGKTLPTNCFLDNGYPVFGGNGQIGWYSSFLYEFPQVLISCRGAASGKVNISAKKSFITNNSLVLDFRESALDYPFLRSWATYNNFSSFVSGSAQPQITIESLSSCEIVVPDDKTMERFNLQVEPMFDKILLNSEQIGTLEATRDSLLPKLMSGKLELKDC
ncbi:MAG: restriction endonuclease subunit S [Alphaproteobacteria bacterium]|nr:restriction endonuclease subunit S [Alphaproteobacteria bacterium]